MIQKSLEIVNKLGLHARAAAKLVALASRFQSNIQIKRGGKAVNGKSIMGVMMLAASKGSKIEVKVTGNDEADAMQQIEKLVGNRFGEEV